MALNKPIKEMPIDRLSALPDSLIIRVLSFLEVKEAAITAVLSKRWQFLWTESPRLRFQESSSQTEKIREFVTRVHRTLVICGRNGLDSFEVEFMFGESFTLDVNVWVGFAVKNKVKEVSLLLKYSSSCKDFYTLPRTMFYNSYLKRLCLQRCVLAPRRTIKWPSLTELQIEEVELQQHVIEKILSGCPVLYCLVLRYCWGFNCLEINTKSLYKLEVCDSDDGVDEPLFEISAPYIQSLWIGLYPRGRKLRLKNIPSLVRATINFTGFDWEFEEVMSNAKELLENIQHVKMVELGSAYIEVLSSVALDGCQFPQSTRTSLSVYVPTEERSIPGIVGLLESSPNLEALVIEGFDFGEEPNSCPDAKGDLDCDLLHLKIITIKNFVDPNLAGEPMLTLARILLKRATGLEKMVVNIGGIATSSSTLASCEPFKIAQTLLSYPRSSQKAIVLLS